MNGRVEWQHLPREAVRGDAATAVARAVGTIMTSIAPNIARMGHPCGEEGQTYGDMHGKAVLKNLDGQPQLVLIVSVMLPGPEASAKLARIARGETP